MKMKRGGMVAALCLLMCCLITALPVAAEAPSLNYGKGLETDNQFTPSELFEALFGESESPLSDAERQALDGLSEAYLRYNDGIPDTVIQREYDGERGELTVVVTPYRYEATNGKTVVWVPETVAVRGGDATSLTLSENGTYTHVFSDFWYSEDLRIDVTFRFETTVDAETADGLLTLPYSLGSRALEAILSYEKLASDYNLAMQDYLDYQAEKQRYDTAKEIYDRYLADLEDFNQKKADYDAYLRKQADYDRRAQEYADYLLKKEAYDNALKAHYEYEAYRAQHAALYDRYELYLMGLEGALSRISIMESMFLYDSHAWQFYGGVMGSTVDTVLAQSYLLETVCAVDPIFIENAEKATVAIRPLLQGYREVRRASYPTGLDRYRAEFAYYAEHYEAIRDNMILLYESIYAIYSNSGVSTALNTHAETKEKVPHFQQFVGQLYVLRCALDDNKTVDPAWTVSPHIKLSLESLVEEKLRVDKTAKASPVGVTLPEEEVKLPDESFPEPVEKPVKDFDDVTDPALEGQPTVVPNPGDPPKEEQDPGDPPEEVLSPEGDAPSEPVLTKEERALAEALQTGALPERAARGEEQTLTLRRTVSCVRSISNRKTVTFYDHAGNPFQTVTVEYGSWVVQPQLPAVNDPRYTYTFRGWVHYGDPEDAPFVSLYSITEDLSLSPVYRKAERLYEIKWEVNGTVKSQSYRYGETPVCPLSTDVQVVGKIYTFLGWSSPVVPVSENAVYQALYDVTDRTVKITWVVGEQIAETEVVYGTVPVCPLSTHRAPDSVLYTFYAWDYGTVEAATEDRTYTALYHETVLAVYQDNTPCRVLHTDSGLILVMEQNVVDFREASAYAVANQMGITFQRGSYSISYTPRDLQILANSLCSKLKWEYTEGETPDAVYFRFSYLNVTGRELNIWLAFTVRTRVEPQAGMSVMAYEKSGSGWTDAKITREDNGSVQVSVWRGVELLIRPEYRLEYSDPTENCDLPALIPSAPVGGTVDLDVNCTYGYEILGAVLTYSDGRTETVTGKSFTMPQGPISVRLLVEPIVYRVTFVSEGKVVHTAEVFFGDRIPLPEDPQKPEDETFYYTFAGWSPYVMSATGEDRAPIYTATFSRTAKEQVTIGGEVAEDRFLTVTLPLALAVLVLLSLTVTLCIIHRRRLKTFIKRVTSKVSPHCKRALRFLWKHLRRLLRFLWRQLKRALLWLGRAVLRLLGRARELIKNLKK